MLIIVLATDQTVKKHLEVHCYCLAVLASAGTSQGSGLIPLKPRL